MPLPSGLPPNCIVTATRQAADGATVQVSMPHIGFADCTVGLRILSDEPLECTVHPVDLYAAFDGDPLPDSEFVADGPTTSGVVGFVRFGPDAALEVTGAGAAWTLDVLGSIQPAIWVPL